MDQEKTSTPNHHANKPDSPAQRAGSCLSSCLFVLMTVLVLLAIDLVSKSWAFKHVARSPVHLTGDNAGQPGVIGPHEAVVVVPKLLSLKLTLNQGAIFGLGQGNQIFFVIVGLLAIFLIGRLFWVSKAKATWTHLALASILAGALGNLYDRLSFSAVRDLFFLFPDSHLPFGWHWPGNGWRPGSDLLYPWIFNFADVCLVVGVVGMMLVTWFSKPPALPPQQSAQVKPD